MLMRIIVVSDTHGDYETLYDIVARNLSADQFIHLGDGEGEFCDIQSEFYDKPFIYIKGNCDWEAHPQSLVTELGGHKFYLCHGHRFEQTRLKEDLAATASVNGCDVALFGHTHVPCSEDLNGVLLFNPGSTSRPRGGSAPSYGVITIAGDGTLSAAHIRLK